MPLDTLNADHIGQVGGGFEPQRQNNILFYVTGLAGNENDVITLSFTSGPLPKSTITPIEVRYLNQIRKFAGTPTFEDMPMVFNDYVDQGTAKVLADWFYLAHNPLTGKTALASQYKKNGRMVLYGPNGEFDREWEIQGAWVSNYDPGDSDHEGEDRVRINCTLTIDKAIYVPSGLTSA
jgi:hypothetical protein